jgi:hypothetical protein
MRKLIFLLVLPLFWGCDKNVEYVSNPQLNLNGNWKIADYTLSFNSTTTTILKIVDNGYVAISPFQVISKDSTTWLVRNDTAGTRPCFIYKRGYQWEFDNNYLILKDNLGNIRDKYRIYFDDPYYGTGFTLVSMTTMETIPGHFDYSRNGNGSMPASQFSLIVPEIWCDVNDASRKFNRAINQSIILTMVR